MKKTSNEISLLKQDIEKTASIKVRTPADFYYLAGLVTGSTNELLSPTTLKRMWGYINGADTVSTSTLNILSRYVGYDNWDDYLSTKAKPQPQCKVLNSCDLKKGELVEICWQPERKVIVKHIEENSYEVEYFENTIFSKGDTFSCPFFILNEPLFISDFSHNHQTPTTCVLGGIGLSSIKILDSTKNLEAKKNAV